MNIHDFVGGIAVGAMVLGTVWFFVWIDGPRRLKRRPRAGDMVLVKRGGSHSVVKVEAITRSGKHFYAALPAYGSDGDNLAWHDAEIIEDHVPSTSTAAVK